MKQITLFIIAILFSSCAPEIPFFDFDALYHYQITEKESSDYSRQKRIKSKEEIKEFQEIAFGENFPESLNDKWYLDKLEKYYPRKQKIEKAKLQEFSEIFTERRREKSEYTTCEPTYRNVFVFKKAGKIVGISKICFECLQNFTIGTNRNTKNLGSHDEYKRLSKLVK